MNGYEQQAEEDEQVEEVDFHLAHSSTQVMTSNNNSSNSSNSNNDDDHHEEVVDSQMTTWKEVDDNVNVIVRPAR
eukprot:CAMPEP_0197826866 /NCGR_PEP_ID=MMETSP1437-20131217/3753_1 /TAXON_ID=49252 ORGANISM="Eucampia antarctica, Strain CCMP1452" /NCGR_SAMPLE_ID=MMETSP1437 /ASSEMBLY_ACC=CAM_ASM_001096 /LENGTH=74 /DNA_ID=CAMNT_0043427477 /DNA_START=26 /DNA_END=247 /DNA_ORIENTATION=+